MTLVTCFKPYYKWIVLNTKLARFKKVRTNECFKPYYKWIVLNTASFDEVGDKALWF